MTARQIIQEIQVLPIEEQREVYASLRDQLGQHGADANEIIYADTDEAMRIAERIFTERAELFQKLAQ